MTHLTVRRMRFDFSDPVDFIWQPENPAFSHAMNMFSFVAVCFEKMIVQAVREAGPLFTDSDVATEAQAFLRQEAQHANAHRQHVAALVKLYPGLQETFDAIEASYDEMTQTTSLAYRLAYIANLEAMFTPSFRFLLDNDAVMFGAGDDRLASLFLWHIVEEVEHRSSALVIFDAVVDKPWFRLRVVPSLLRHLFGTLIPLYADGVNTHVPEADRVIDARSITLPVQLHRSLQWTGRSRPRTGVFADVARRDKLKAIFGLIRSQNPFFDPSGERISAFADEWFERYERGDDVTHWYGSKVAG
ncbi:metal-dependent hydrolase [Mycolicibacterium rhodesiae]|uniref:Metal-dependent hydrolase n=1 Tax=Mycolicibacterium rhodesiae TaxID=36814 RepID=A0A1X0J667_MYCRH|nr:metal-dependent hydrolase [Mycolicibacterium rhodesiae]MCV7344456.1 metal-dependent hydrolase [Mycolicibacterium rhodesiae]ORB57480.1 metal-dependent hydrolase [Mycolicibacterium rhodesiae]